MNEKSDQSKDSPAETDAPPEDAEFPEIDETLRIEETVEQQKPSRAPLSLSLLALLLSAIAVAGAAYVAFRPVTGPAPILKDTAAIDALSDAVRSGTETLAKLQRRLGEIERASAEVPARLDKLRQQFANELAGRLGAYESLPGRLENVENSLSSMHGISTGVRDTWLLAEAEYYMQIANAQLQLAANPHLARLALLQADERIRQLANPALTNVRMTLSDELRALEAVSSPDIEGMTLTLASLARVVASLPIKQELEIPLASTDAVDGELSGLDRAFASLKSTLDDVVSVRRTDEAVRPLIAPEAAFFLRANLSLQLQVARLALLRGEQAAFQQSLDDANRWLGQYFHADSAEVQSARQTIHEVRDGMPDIALPDISESLRLLRQHGTLSATPSEAREPAEIRPES
jgi:uroporphyrin-3 C-methyltransferase